MLHILMPVFLASQVILSSSAVTKTASNGYELKAKPLYILTQKQGLDPHGDDPHGDDSHEEGHDKNLPSNQQEKARKAPTDPYGGQSPAPPDLSPPNF